MKSKAKVVEFQKVNTNIVKGKLQIDREHLIRFDLIE